MENHIDKLQALIGDLQTKLKVYRETSRSLEEDIEGLFNMVSDYEKKIEKYDSWMNEKGYVETGVGYFNCLPTELVNKISVHLSKNELALTCKSFTYIIYEKFRYCAVRKLGVCSKYLEDEHPGDYELWFGVIKRRRLYPEKRLHLEIGKGYVIEINRGDIRTIISKKVYNYTDEDWFYHSEIDYINSKGIFVTMIYESAIVCVGTTYHSFTDCYTKLILPFHGVNRFVFIPKSRCDRDRFIELINNEGLYGEYKDQLYKLMSTLE